MFVGFYVAMVIEKFFSETELLPSIKIKNI